MQLPMRALFHGIMLLRFENTQTPRRICLPYLTKVVSDLVERWHFSYHSKVIDVLGIPCPRDQSQDYKG